MSDGVSVVGVSAEELRPDPHEVLRRAIERFERVREVKRRQCDQRLRFADGPVGLVFVADQHIGNDGTDYQRMFHEADLIRCCPRLYVVQVGDLVDNFIVSKLMKIRMGTHMAIDEEWELARLYLQRVGPRLVAVVGGNHECLDSETECLTRRGWLRWSSLRMSDEVLSLDPDSGAAVWSRIGAIHSYDGSVKLHRLVNNQVDMAVTGNHRVLHKVRRGSTWGEYEFAEAASLQQGRIGIPVSGLSDRADYPLSDDELRLAAWILTDGSMGRADGSGRKDTRVSIFQRESKAHLVQSILDRLGVGYSRFERNRPSPTINGVVVKTKETEVEFRLLSPWTYWVRGKLLDRKDSFPGWVWALSDRQFDIFLSALVDGDGTRPAGGDDGTYAFYNRAPLVNQLQSACIQHGYSASVYAYRDRAGRQQYRLNISRREVSQLDIAGEWWTEDYDGVVWCLTVPQGNFAVRRNGKAYFTGNSWTGACAGVDQLRDIVTGLRSGILYHPDELYLTVEIGSTCWPVRVRHKWRYSSILNPTHGIERAFERDQLRPFVLGVGAHTHVSGLCRQFNAGGRTGLAVQVGSYKVYDSFAATLGLPAANGSTAVTVVFHPGHGMVGYDRLEAALDVLS